MENIYFETKSGLVTVGRDTQKIGDVNGDGAVNLTDASLVLRMALKMVEYPNLMAADMNKDGAITLEDVSLILKAALKIYVFE